LPQQSMQASPSDSDFAGIIVSDESKITPPFRDGGRVGRVGLMCFFLPNPANLLGDNTEDPPYPPFRS
jgi:hypothetical protein